MAVDILPIIDGPKHSLVLTKRTNVYAFAKGFISRHGMSEVSLANCGSGEFYSTFSGIFQISIGFTETSV